MLIILEGLDLAGKSYIAEQLLKGLPNCFYMKQGNRPKDKSEEERSKIQDTYYAMLEAWTSINDPNTNMIFDRYYPSELVYSLPKRGYDAFEDKIYRDLEGDLLSYNDKVLVLYVFTHKEELLKRFEVRGDDYMTPGDIDILLSRYNAFIAQTRLAVCQIQSGTPINEIMEMIQK